MSDILKLENIKIIDSVKDWKEAINVSLQELVKQGYCSDNYVDGVFSNTEKYGPYYVLCENLALIHASSDQGAIRSQIAITLLNKPIKFKEDGLDVRLLVALVATDSESHLHALQALSTIFEKQESINQILNAKSEQVIYDMFIALMNN